MTNFQSDFRILILESLYTKVCLFVITHLKLLLIHICTMIIEVLPDHSLFSGQGFEPCMMPLQTTRHWSFWVCILCLSVYLFSPPENGSPSKYYRNAISQSCGFLCSVSVTASLRSTVKSSLPCYISFLQSATCHSAFHWSSEWRDSNSRPLDPKSSVLPNWTTLR